MTDWLHVVRGEAPLIVSLPHAGTLIPPEIETRLTSPWLGRKDADWHVERLYDFVGSLGATTIRTAMSRTVIDVNRDPSGASLYPGQATTGLCPTTTFDGEDLYVCGSAPDADEIAARRASYFDPYHSALAAEIARLKTRHSAVILYDAHSIRSRVPRLFDGLLPHFNIGTNGGRSCASMLTAEIERVCEASAFTRVTNGRFKGGYITRRYGRPDEGVHAVQMELACRSYMDDPGDRVSDKTWPAPYRSEQAAPMRAALTDILSACIQVSPRLAAGPHDASR